MHWLIGLHVPSPLQTEELFTMYKRGPPLTKDAIAGHDRACSHWCIAPTPVYFWTLSGIRCGPDGFGENKLVCPGHLTVQTVLNMPHWIRFATDDEKNAQCTAGEEPQWWRRLEADGVPIRPKAFLMGIGSDATVAVPDHVIGGKGRDVTVLMNEPEVWCIRPIARWTHKAVDPKLLDGARTPPTPNPFDSDD